MCVTERLLSFRSTCELFGSCQFLQHSMALCTALHGNVRIRRVGSHIKSMRRPTCMDLSCLLHHPSIGLWEKKDLGPKSPMFLIRAASEVPSVRTNNQSNLVVPGQIHGLVCDDRKYACMHPSCLHSGMPWRAQNKILSITVVRYSWFSFTAACLWLFSCAATLPFRSHLAVASKWWGRLLGSRNVEVALCHAWKPLLRNAGSIRSWPNARQGKQNARSSRTLCSKKVNLLYHSFLNLRTGILSFVVDFAGKSIMGWYGPDAIFWRAFSGPRQGSLSLGSAGAGASALLVCSSAWPPLIPS